MTTIPPEVLDQIKAELRRQFADEGCCPICRQKKRPSFTAERKKTMSEAMKVPRNRVSPTTTKILLAISQASETFTLTEISNKTDTSKNTVREIVRRLAIAQELRIGAEVDSRHKTSKFGTGVFWNQLEKDGNIPLKSLPS
ncbi:hypothetical protein [Pelobacter propionicus]|uniref:Uncharacterized protein n=1 Tax=Pelobacter propionicus (strain DSM 2379 / NBRC 103807 / OttBd1) TaxID=338966 RepID=A0R7U2_PELPD|nr:hypothetical protein [Pelobacter propionicus]ABL01407.1 hypothetical protein Ppro_3819 [Pelobacter propionicus DSM 2379]